MDIDPSKIAHLLFGKLSALCMVLAEGKSLELGVSTWACTLERSTAGQNEK